MKHKIAFIALVFTYIFSSGCNNETKETRSDVIVGAERIKTYLPILKNKNIGLVVNQTSMVDTVHLIDFLYSKDINLKAIYAPEHGYKGNVEAGKHFNSTTDPNTGVPVFSIYGKNRKPTPEMLKGIDIIIFDIQDVGVRFFTYISTLNYVMEACAENNIKVVVFDRPNPLGYYVDGPVLKPEYRSFIGMKPIPVVHGLTVGEYAMMSNGEGWLKNRMKCELEVIKMENYTHATRYQLPIFPSPNLPDMKSIYLYPSICLFEGIKANEGRGTDHPFQQFGAPYYSPQNFSYVPKSIPGKSLHPKFEGKTCYGYDLSKTPLEELQNINQIQLKYVIDFYNKCDDKEHFFTNFFEKLAGNDELRKQITEGKTEAEIRASWQDDLNKYKEMREKYLLYED